MLGVGLRYAFRTMSMLSQKGRASSLVLTETAAPAVVKGRMFSVQQSLPHLPVPPLEQTMNKFLKSIKPINSEEQYHSAEKLVAEFKNSSEVQKLQSLLEMRAKEKINWLSEWWLNTAYLEFRIPTAIHVNPGLMFPTQNFSGEAEQLRYAAKLVAGILDYKVMIDEQTLPVEKLGGKPLCMAQYYEILSSCRIPGTKRDRVVTFPPDQPNPPKHICVAHNNHFFAVDVYGQDGKPLSTEQLYKQLKYVVQESTVKGIPYGLLTSDGRNAWAKAYETLMKDKTNRASIEKIQRSIFLLCLDQPLPHCDPEERLSLIANQMNHGGGHKLNSSNRWFDKTLQFIVGADGGVGLNYEHAPAEGPPIVSLVDHALRYVLCLVLSSSSAQHRNKKQGKETRLSASKPRLPEKLEFKLVNKIPLAITQAKDNINSTVADLSLRSFVFTKFGKNFIKSQKLSPDAFIQVNLQLAYFRLYGHNVATYESGSLRRFQLGRTDTIRSCTIEANRFCKAMDDSSVSPSTKADYLREAVAAHRHYTDDVVNGQGIDRHLLGLKLTALENGMKVPRLLLDPVYTDSCHWKLSTSQVPSTENAVLCFAPVVPDGYGFCYNPQADVIRMAVSSWNSCPETDARKLQEHMIGALTDSQTLLVQTQKAKL